jgi:choline dehydrogenase-like flavoprotein
MILDARRAETPERIEADVAIVGAGAAGIVMALELAESGLMVVLVEAGGDKFSTAAQEFYRAEAVEPASHGPIDMFRRRVLGGSTRSTSRTGPGWPMAAGRSAMTMSPRITRKR